MDWIILINYILYKYNYNNCGRNRFKDIGFKQIDFTLGNDRRENVSIQSLNAHCNKAKVGRKQSQVFENMSYGYEGV